MNTPAPPPRAPAAAPAGNTRRITRADILALAPRPCDFLPLALAGLKVAPADHELRLHAIVALARLGLAAPARELLETLPAELRAHPEVAKVHASIPAGDPSRIAVHTLIDTARRNLEALLAIPTRVFGLQPAEVRSAFERWAQALPTTEWHGTGAGNFVRRVPGSWQPEHWRGLADARAAAARFAQEHLRFDPTTVSGQMPGPFVVEGADPPWVLERLLTATTPAQRPGVPLHHPRVRIVQADPAELFDGLAQADLSASVAHERVECFVGPQAGAALAARLASERDTINAGPCVVTTGIRTRTTPPADSVIERARLERQSDVRVAVERAEAMYAGRDARWWAGRFREALSGTGEPLRVLIPTCRYSTFVRHASADLAGAFERAGIRARVLIEPDASSRLSALAYLDAIESHKPDLIVLINYARGQVSPHIPRNIPWITWVQDAMPHLFTPAFASGISPLDFVAGHIYSALVENLGVPADRFLAMPVVADNTKFHDGPIDPALAQRLACDVAYVSHQSQTPDDLHAQLIREGSVAPEYLPALEAIRAAMPSIVDAGLENPASPQGIQRRVKCVVRDVVRERLRALGAGEPDPAVLGTIARVHALPLAERHMRHRALEWTAEICRRRGWSLRLHGSGWEKHPTLAPFASGPLEHGDELRASYQSARCHLHISLTAPVHQRVMECALSGGLPLVRLHADGLEATRVRACIAAARSSAATRTDDPRGWIGWDAIDHPAIALWVALRQRLGLPSTDAEYIIPARLSTLDTLDLLTPPELDVSNLLVDPAEVCFWDRASLERTLERAITDEAFRRSRSNAIASRVRRSLTHDAIASRMVRFVQERLDQSRTLPSPTKPLAA